MKRSRKDQIELLPFHVIEKAVKGDTYALNVILKHYERYINTLATRKGYDEFGDSYYYVDETLKGMLQNKLIKKTLEFKM